MSEIDWSKARPGYDIHINWGDRSHFYQIIGDRHVRKNGFYAVISEVKETEGVVVTVRPSAWSGDGLPPVGTYIEWLSDQYGWLGGRVVGHDGMVAVVSHNDGYTGCHAHEIRPIRTPEQIAAEERYKAVRAIELHILKAQEQYLSVVQTAQIIYGAGFQVPKQ